MDRESFVAQGNEHLEQLFELVTHRMKYDGDTCADSQRMCLINRLFDVQHALNGVETADLL